MVTVLKLNKKKGEACVENKKRKKLPIRYTIVGCFFIFTTVLIAMLWIFQTVFLDSFYKSIKISQVKAMSESVAFALEHVSDDESFGEMSNMISRQADMTILIYDTSGSVYAKIYPSQSGVSAYLGMREFKTHEVYRYYKEAKENGGSITEIVRGAEYTGTISSANKDSVPDDYRYPFGGLKWDKREIESVVYAQIVNISQGEYFIVIDSVVTPVNSTVETLRVQLVIITWILLLLSLILAYIISRIIAEPIIKVNKNAKELAKQNFSVDFSGGGYREIQELNATLNFAAEELSKVDKLRQEFIANVSHDLRTPLTMIIGYGEVIRDLPGENTPENIQIIIDEATRLNVLVNDLLDISKLQAGAMQVERSEFSLTRLIENIFSRYSKLTAQKGFQFIFDYDCDVTVRADEVKITQVIYNLINNAVNYAGEDKTVIVRQKVDKGSVVIEVEDHGEGIEPEKLDLIWDRYYKVDKTHKSSVIGTGIGLSIVKNILKLHSADYGVRSKLGEGSVFWFKIPYEECFEDAESVALSKEKESSE